MSLFQPIPNAGAADTTRPLADRMRPRTLDEYVGQEHLVTVEIPKHLDAGVQLPAVGISLTPVDSTGASLTGSEGVPDGAAVLVANTQTDSDTVLKPSTLGVEASEVLRKL